MTEYPRYNPDPVSANFERLWQRLDQQDKDLAEIKSNQGRELADMNSRVSRLELIEADRVSRSRLTRTIGGWVGWFIATVTAVLGAVHFGDGSDK